MAEPAMQTVHYFLAEGLSDWEAAYALALLNTPIGTPLRRYRVITVAETSGAVTTMAGLKVTPNVTVDAVSPAESALLVLPGANWESGLGGGALELARAFVKANTPLAAICGATWGIARAGLLDDRRHTSNAREYIATSEYRGQALYVDERAVNDGGVITASATGALEFAREIFTQLEYYPRPIIEAWYQLYRTGDPKYYAELTKGTSGG